MASPVATLCVATSLFAAPRPGAGKPWRPAPWILSATHAGLPREAAGVSVRPPSVCPPPPFSPTDPRLLWRCHYRSPHGTIVPRSTVRSSELLFANY
jgi:hypothetical protein